MTQFPPARKRYRTNASIFAWSAKPDELVKAFRKAAKELGCGDESERRFVEALFCLDNALDPRQCLLIELYLR
jgi:hypothetical protein